MAHSRVYRVKIGSLEKKATTSLERTKHKWEKDAGPKGYGRVGLV
jgi:hypothetical protein